MRLAIGFILVGILLFWIPVSATVRHVPSQYATIQAGIDASVNGDTVLVAPGRYRENLIFQGRNILLTSNYIFTGERRFQYSTIIDGRQLGSTILLRNGEDSTAEICGFMIINGNYSGIKCIGGANPRIVANIITNNSNNNDGGGGIYTINANLHIYDNIISHNEAYQGAAIWAENCTGEIHHNIIFRNFSWGVGCGILIFQGGGIRIYNNTLCFNGPETGDVRGAIYIVLASQEPSIFNNIIAYNTVGLGEFLSIPFSTNYNDVYFNREVNYYNCQPGQLDLSIDPSFLCQEANDFRLDGNSACIDVGNPESPLDPDSTIADIGSNYFDHATLSRFSLNSPIGWTEVTEQPVTVTWEQSFDSLNGNEVFYKIYWATDPNFVETDSLYNITDTSITLPYVMERSQYVHWDVVSYTEHNLQRVANGCGYFHIDGYPTPPIIFAPQNAIHADSSTIFSWYISTDPDSFDVVSYTIQIDNDSAFASPEVNQSGLQSGVILDDAFAIRVGELEGHENLQADTRYFWRVRADDNYGLSSDWTDGTNWFVFMAQNHPPNAPDSGFFPTGGEEVISLTPLITWANASDPDPDDHAENLAYAIRLSTDSSFAGFIYYDTTGMGINQIQPVAELADNTRYYYEIKTIDDGGLSSDWSARQDFWTNHYNFPPEPFPLMAPLPEAKQVVANTHFTWGHTVDYDPNSSFTYAIQFSLDSTFNWIARQVAGVNDTTITVATDTIALVGASPFWRVVAIDDDGLMRIGGIPEQARKLIILSPGDANGSGGTTGLDVTFLVNYFKGRNSGPDPLLAGDANGSCTTTGLDVTYMVRYFKGMGPAPRRCGE